MNCSNAKSIFGGLAACIKVKPTPLPNAQANCRGAPLGRPRSQIPVLLHPGISLV